MTVGRNGGALKFVGGKTIFGCEAGE